MSVEYPNYLILVSWLYCPPIFLFNFIWNIWCFAYDAVLILSHCSLWFLFLHHFFMVLSVYLLNGHCVWLPFLISSKDFVIEQVLEIIKCFSSLLDARIMHRFGIINFTMSELNLWSKLELENLSMIT